MPAHASARPSLNRRSPRPLWRSAWAVCVALALLVSLAACSPKAEKLDSPITEQIQAGIKGGASTFDHADFDALLKKHVNAKGMVDYAAIKADAASLDSYLDRLAKADLAKLSRDDQMALLINAYNAYTLKLIVENLGKIKSIRDIDKPWDTSRYKVGGHTLSLNDIEHGLLRPIYKDPRIHFAVNCASIGCPLLMPQAFTGATLDTQLDAATKGFAQSTKYVRRDGDTLRLSKILKWYGDDFTNPQYKGHAKTVAAYVARHAPANVQELVKAKGGDPTVAFLDYDWNLNTQ